MRRWIVSLFGTLLIGLLLAPAVSAANPHFVSGPVTSTEGGALVTSGSIAGLGNEDVTIEVDATAIVTCENRGGHKPPGQTETVSGSQTITDVKNGRVDFQVITGEVSDPCPGPMEPTVEFTSATITVFQGGEVVLQETFDPAA
jgi:hypothetical protein